MQPGPLEDVGGQRWGRHIGFCFWRICGVGGGRVGGEVGLVDELVFPGLEKVRASNPEREIQIGARAIRRR